MRRLEVGRARRGVDVFAVAEPELVHAARGLARAVEERDRFRLLRHRDVEQLEARRLLALLLGLVGDRHQVAAGLQRVRAHVGLRQVGLHHHLGLARIGHVDGGEILRRAFMRQPEDAAAVRRDLDRHAFAHAAEAVEQVVAEQLEIPGDRPAVAAGRGRLRGWFLGCGFLAADFLVADFLGAGFATAFLALAGAAFFAGFLTAAFFAAFFATFFLAAFIPFSPCPEIERTFSAFQRGMRAGGHENSDGLDCHPGAADGSAPLRKRRGRQARAMALVRTPRDAADDAPADPLDLRRLYALALAQRSGRSAFFQSGMAEIFFSRSSTSASFCRFGTRSVGKPGSTSTRASALAKVSRDMV